MTTKAGVDGSRPSEAALLEQGNRMSDTGGYEEVKAKDIESHGEAGSGTDVESLATMNQEKNMESLSALGGVEALAKTLGSDPLFGIDAASQDSRQQEYGCNKLPDKEGESFFSLLWGNLQDPIIILLIFAAAVSTALGAGIPEQRAKNEWIEGVAIWVAVILVAGIGAANDYAKDLEFRKLNKQKEAIEIKVIRNGDKTKIMSHDVVVGDLVILGGGDKIIADMVLIKNQGLIMDEASLTGESEPIKKSTGDPWIRSGTMVREGSGTGLVIAVGQNSEWGKTIALMEESEEEATPLQQKLGVVAELIGKVGFAVAISCFLAMLIQWLVINKGGSVDKINQHGPISFFLYAITIIVVAVPEGLPLAVTISLAYSMKKMLIDQNFVRHLSACETMGGATTICSDKTGTLTQNRMTVTEGFFAGTKYSTFPALGAGVSAEFASELALSISCSSEAYIIDKPGGRHEFVGSSTECALLLTLKDWDFDYKQIRIDREKDKLKAHGFTSARKMSSVVIRMPNGKIRNYVKGAAEWVVKKCTQVLQPDGSFKPLDGALMEETLAHVFDMANRGLRCICLTYVEYPEDTPIEFFDDPIDADNNLIIQSIVGIKDPVRPEVPAAVATCQRAGIIVRMVTGDNIHTAMHIATDCGIIADEEHTAMEGPTFRKMHAEKLLELQALLPNLRVLARSSPEDKLTLVKLLKEAGHVVAVTGDGTNDGPALKESDVGLAMGIAGTEVAKEAADIIILDDNFSSIVKSVLWGRSVFNNIRKFLQFQLTVNTSALIICFIGAVVGMLEPLNVLQLLWVNLIMDTMGALALATEAPSLALLDDPPHGHEEPLINRSMWRHIMVQGMFQVIVMLICLYGLPTFINRYKALSQSEYYSMDCSGNVAWKLNIPRGDPSSIVGVFSISYATAPKGANSLGSGPDAAWYCGVMMSCGFPMNSQLRSSTACPLYNAISLGLVNASWPTTNINISSNQADALCFNNYNISATLGASCLRNDQFNSARSWMSTEYTERLELDEEYKLAFLFNSFIWMQIFNEINCRRIKDEYDFFAGLHKSPIFMGVIALSILFQIIIMQFLGIFFKVVPQLWQEWLVSIAIGFCSSILSWIQRFITRNFNVLLGTSVVGLRRGSRVATASGRTNSGRSSLKRVGSIVSSETGSMRAAPGLDGKWGAGGGSQNGGGSLGRGSVRQLSGRQNSGKNTVKPFDNDSTVHA